MMLLKNIPQNILIKKLKKGLIIKIGSFNFKICILNKSAMLDFINIYSDFQLLDDDVFIDFDIVLKSPNILRRWFYPQISFYCNGTPPFTPLPIEQGYAMLEWGMNWCIVSHANQFLILHAAVIEKNNKAVIMPGQPGAGKSTLCSALINRGWRLLSDELTLISLKNGDIYPISRPVNLKNESIDIIKGFEPSSIFSNKANDTHKGTVSLLKPPTSSVARANITATPKLIVLPKYKAQSELTINNMDEKELFFSLINNSFNYNVLGVEGFNATIKLINQVQSMQLEYSNLNDAIDLFNQLSESL